MDVEFILSDPIKRRVWNEHWSSVKVDEQPN